jgi:hypothetical protein
MATLTLILDASWIAFPYPTKFSTMGKSLKCGFNMMAIICWTRHVSKDFRNSKKDMITFITSNYIILWKRRILLSNCSKILSPLQKINFHVHTKCNSYCQSIWQQLVAPQLIHHTCQYNRVQTTCDCFNNNPHLGFKVFFVIKTAKFYVP